MLRGRGPGHRASCRASLSCHSVGTGDGLLCWKGQRYSWVSSVSIISQETPAWDLGSKSRLGAGSVTATCAPSLATGAGSQRVGRDLAITSSWNVEGGWSDRDHDNGTLDGVCVVEMHPAVHGPSGAPSKTDGQETGSRR